MQESPRFYLEDAAEETCYQLCWDSGQLVTRCCLFFGDLFSRETQVRVMSLVETPRSILVFLYGVVNTWFGCAFCSSVVTRYEHKFNSLNGHMETIGNKGLGIIMRYRWHNLSQRSLYKYANAASNYAKMLLNS